MPACNPDPNQPTTIPRGCTRVSVANGPSFVGLPRESRRIHRDPRFPDGGRLFRGCPGLPSRPLSRDPSARKPGTLPGLLGACAALLLALTVSACGARPASFDAVPPSGVGGAGVPAEASCQLDAVAFRRGPSGPEGRVSPLEIRVRPNPSQEVRVAVYEEMSGGTGDMWDATTWVAAVHASTVLGRPLRDYEVSVSVGGLIDGPSAGALVTAGMIATMQGVPVRSGVTMTGTVNPDGTVGPVGGVEHKMRAAAAAGKRAFGYPRGSRFEVDPRGGEPVDLRALGARLGIEVHEIADIEDAYALLTGRSMPSVSPMPRRRMVASPAVEQRMRAQIGAWQTLVRDGLAYYDQQPEPVQQLLRSDAEQTLEYWRQAQGYMRQGLIATAYKRARDAAIHADNIPRSARLLVYVLTYDLDALRAEADAMLEVEGEVDTYFAALRATRPGTVGEALTLLGAYGYGLRARSAVTKGRAEVVRGLGILRIVGGAAGSELDEDERADAIGRAGVAFGSAIAWYGAARMLMTVGKDGVALDVGRTTTASLDVTRLVDLAHSTTIAAKAVFDYYDAVTVQRVAERHAISASEARGRLRANDAEYRNASLFVAVALRNRQPRDVHDALLTLAAAEQAFVDTSLLVMRDYSLGVRVDRTGRAVAVRNDLAFANALEAADLRAREAAAVAAARIGRIPDAAAVTYERARMMREGSLDDRFVSLRGMWSAAVRSRTAGHLAAVPDR